MLFQLLANGLRTPDVGFDTGNIRWRRGGWGSQHVLQEPDAANHGGRINAVGGERQYSGLAQKTPAARIGNLDAREARRGGVSRSIGNQILRIEPVDRHSELTIEFFQIDAINLANSRLANV